MKYAIPSYRIFPLGDSGMIIDFGNQISPAINDFVHSLFQQLQAHKPGWLSDIVPAYSSLGIHFDLSNESLSSVNVALNWIEEQMHNLPDKISTKAALKNIPVCYSPDLAKDLMQVAESKNLSIADLIKHHTQIEYRVYMLGFLPGFAYMGEVDSLIAVNRKKIPEHVTAGSVGIASSQTGIYPVDSPGGWQIIGRTPLKIFDPNKEDPFLLQPGDRVTFYSIPRNEFESY